MFIRKVLDPSTNLVRRPTPWPWLGESTVVLDSELPRRRIWHDWRLGNQAGLLPKVCSATLQQAHVYEYVTCGYTPLQWQITPFSTLIFSYIVFPRSGSVPVSVPVAPPAPVALGASGRPSSLSGRHLPLGVGMRRSSPPSVTEKRSGSLTMT